MKHKKTKDSKKFKTKDPKKFKTIDEQYDILVNQRKLKIENVADQPDIIKKELLKKNYFDLVNGLDDIINSSDEINKYYGDYSFDDLFELYNLNKEIRELILSVIGDFEIKLKTSIAYNFSSIYSKWDDYRKTSNYRIVTGNDVADIFFARYGYSKNYVGKQPKVNSYNLFPFFVKDPELIKKFKRRKRYLSAYGGHPPVWVAIKALNFGNLRIMFSLLNADVADKVLSDFDLKLVDRNRFISTLDVINWLRNECAHFEMINKSKYHGKYPLDKELIESLKIRTNKSRRNLNLFQAIYILNDVQELKNKFNALLCNFRIDKLLKEKYLKDIGYWNQCKW